MIIEENSVQPVVTESKRKLVFLYVFVTLLIIALGIIGFLAYQNYQLQQKIAQVSATLSSLPTIAPTAVPTVVAGQTVGWKAFNRNGMLFKYPQEWVINTSSDIISSRVPPITLVAVPKDRTLMNECMDMISTSMVSDVVVKKFARVSAGEMCATDDTSSRQIWVVESEDSYSPGLSYQYSAQDSVSAEKIFDQILSTFKFIDANAFSAIGTVTGKVCYPSEGIPAGVIRAKNVDTGEITSLDHPIDVPSFSFDLEEGVYKLRFEPGGNSTFPGYHTGCSGVEQACQDNTKQRSSIPVTVRSEKTTSEVKLCDFYYSNSLQPDF